VATSVHGRHPFDGAAANVNQWLKQERLETNAGIPYMAGATVLGF
jgi:hypothetical protein